MKEYLKERLTNYRTNKILVWQTLLANSGGFLGLLLKAVNIGTNPVEILLMFFALIIIAFLLYLTSILSYNINKVQGLLKKEEMKNE
jgi:hypothetical protein